MIKTKTSYGIADFKKLRFNQSLYIDKTRFIELLENFGAEYVFFIRPRRFGKSLFLSMLSNYYDIKEAENFSSLFDDLYIGKNPTLLKNSYLMLQLDFSGLNTENKEVLKDSFRSSLLTDIRTFLDKYKNIFSNIDELEKEIRKTTDVKEMLGIIFNLALSKDKKIYIIIDEYDHFANDIIAMGDGKFYRDIVRATGFVRDFYETIKIGTKTVVDRIFITGISPIMLDDLTSGFNIAANLSLEAGLNEMLGFTEDEVRYIIGVTGLNVILPVSHYERQDGSVPDNVELLVSELRGNYNGYLFNIDGIERVYNPDMILHFFSQYQRNGRYPQNLIDDNVKTDYGRLHRLTINEENRQALEKIIKDEGVTADIATRFSFDNMYEPRYFVSLLFYMGLLTIKKQERMRLLLEIPNFVIRTVFWEYLIVKLQKEHNIRIETEAIRLAIEEMAYNGNLEPYISYISENILKPLSNRDLIKFDEKYIKIILFAYLCESNAYRPRSEMETEDGYIDIYLEKDQRLADIEYEWLLELKYLKKSDADKIEAAKAAGIRQLERYARSSRFTGKDKLKKAVVIFSGKDDYDIVEL